MLHRGLLWHKETVKEGRRSITDAGKSKEAARAVVPDERQIRGEIRWMDFEGTLTRIPNVNAPSWSWMAYEGGIDYLKPPFNEMTWNKNLHSPWSDKSKVKQSLTEMGGSSRAIELTADARPFLMAKVDSSRDKVIYDSVGGTERTSRDLECVVVGKTHSPGKLEQFYILLVSKDRNWIDSEKGGSAKYIRVGVGQVSRACIDFGVETEISVH